MSERRWFSEALRLKRQPDPCPIQSSIGLSKIFTTIREEGYGQTIYLRPSLLETIYQMVQNEAASTWLFYMIISGSKLYGQDYEPSSLVPERTMRLRGYPRLANWYIAAGLTQTNNDDVDDS